MNHLVASIPVVSPVFQVLLDSIGWILAKLFDIIGSYGVSIVLLTILIRVVLFPLTYKQIKSMQSMQALGPKIKELQKKYKGNKTKINEETMKLYSQYGVSPLGGCLPLLLTFPFLIAMYAVIRAPALIPAVRYEGHVYQLDDPGLTSNTDLAVRAYLPRVYLLHGSHLPVDSELFRSVVQHENTQFIGVGLQCSAGQAGSQAQIKDSKGDPVVGGAQILTNDGTALPFQAASAKSLNCGSGVPDKIPYFLFLALMIGTTFYQQRQMTKASPPGAQSQQQQAIMRVMPLMFAFIGFNFPAGLVLYWTIANSLQIGQQAMLLKLGHIGPGALERQAAMAPKTPKKPGRMTGLMARADEERKRREAEMPKTKGKPPSKSSGSKSSGQKKSGSAGQKKKPTTGGTKPGQKKKPTSGGKRG